MTTGQIGPFRLLGELGSGRSAVVFRARHVASFAEVALKVWRDTGPAAVENFLRECRIHAVLSGACGVVPHVTSSTIQDDQLWAAQQLGEGSLAGLVEQHGPPPVAAGLALALDVVDAVRTVHAHGVLHRDVTPANLVLLRGRAALTDFGLAVPTGSVGHDPAAGTAPFVAPELLAGGLPTSASDVYALGLTLFRLLGSAAQSVPVLAETTDSDPLRRPDIARLRAGVSDALGGVLALGHQAPAVRPSGRRTDPREERSVVVPA